MKKKLNNDEPNLVEMFGKPVLRLVPVSRINVPGSPQARLHTAQTRVDRFCDLTTAGVELPPPIGFEDEVNGIVYMGDGIHRTAGGIKAGLSHIKMYVYPGGFEAATRYSWLANTGHGVDRTKGDKRRIARNILLKNPQAGSAFVIYHMGGKTHAGFTVNQVNGVRKKLVEEGLIVLSDQVMAKDGTMKARKAFKDYTEYCRKLERIDRDSARATANLKLWKGQKKALLNNPVPKPTSAEEEAYRKGNKRGHKLKVTEKQEEQQLFDV